MSAPPDTREPLAPNERYPGELQALVGYWTDVAGLTDSDARKHAEEYLVMRRRNEALTERMMLAALTPPKAP